MALGCMAIWAQSELMIRRVHFIIRRTKGAATQATYAGNARGYYSECGTNVSIIGEMMTRIICFDHNNSYYSFAEPVTEDEI